MTFLPHVYFVPPGRRVRAYPLLRQARLVAEVRRRLIERGCASQVTLARPEDVKGR